MILMTAFAIMLPTILGFLFVAYYLRSHNDFSIFETLIFGYGIGMAFVTFMMFILGLLSIKFSLIAISLIQIMTIGTLIFLIMRSGVPVSKLLGLQTDIEKLPEGEITRAEAWLVISLAVWILCKFIFVVFESSILPVHAWDSWAMWSAGAKFFFYKKGLFLDPKDEHFFGWGIRGIMSYPLHIFLIQTWFSLCTGVVHEVAMKFWNVLYFISTIGLVFFAMKRETPLVTAMLTAFFLSSAPLLTYHALDAYADLSVAFYALAATVCFWKYISESGKNRDSGKYLVLMGIFATCAFWTKLEGLFYVISFSMTLILFHLVKKIPFRRIFSYFVPLSFVAVIWYIFLYSYHISFVGREKKAFTGMLHFEIFRAIWKQIMFYGNFNIIFFIFFVILFFGARTILRSDLKYLFSALFGVMFLFIIAYLATEEYKWAVDVTASNRNIMTFIPMIYYISALTISRWLQDLTKDKKKIEKQRS